MATVTSTPTEAVVVSPFGLDMVVEIISPAVLAEARSDQAYVEFARLLGPACEAAFQWKTGGAGRETKTLATRLPLVLTKKNGEVRHSKPEQCKALALRANVKTTDRWIVIGSVLTIVSDKGKVEAKDGDLAPAITVGKVVNQCLNKDVGFPAMLAAVRAVTKDESPTQAKAIAALRKLGAPTKAKAKDAESESDSDSDSDETTTEIVTPADEFTLAVDAVLTALDAVALLVNGEEWQAIDLARLNARLGAPIKV